MLLASRARSLGATVIGTVSSEEKARLARERGCHHMIVSREYRFAGAVKQVSGGHGADLIIDGLGQKAQSENLDALAQFSQWVSLGHASGVLAPVDTHGLLAKSATISVPVVFHYTDDAPRLRQMADRLWIALQSGAARAHIGARYPLGATAEAHRALESRGTRGSIVLLP